MREVDRKISELIDRFPWRSQASPEMPPDPVDPNRRKQAVNLWLEESTREFGATALALMARVKPVLQALEEESVRRSGPRLMARIDASHLVKTPEGILEKMARKWLESPQEPPPILFDTFRDKLKDLGRFRIVANFLSDVKLVTSSLSAPYDSSPDSLAAPANPKLVEAQRKLQEDFDLVNGAFDDMITVAPAKRKSGERCFKTAFVARLAPTRVVEVQVQTMLEEAWDKKDHFLVYERKRKGLEIPLEEECEMFAMSELLYVADRTFDRLRIALENGGGKGAP